MKGLSQARARKQGPRATLRARGTGSVGDSVGEGRLSCCHVVHRFGVDGGYIVDIFGRDCVVVLEATVVHCVVCHLRVEWCHIIHSMVSHHPLFGRRLSSGGDCFMVLAYISG